MSFLDLFRPKMSRETLNSVMDLAEGGTLRGPPPERTVGMREFAESVDAMTKPRTELDDPTGYGAPLVSCRASLNRFEHLAAMVSAGNGNQLRGATVEAHELLMAARMLVAWCERQKWAGR